MEIGFSLMQRIALRIIILILVALASGCGHTGQSVFIEQRNKIADIPGKWRSRASIVLDSRTELVFREGRSGNLVDQRDVIWLYVNKRNPNHWENISYFEYETFEKPIKIQATVHYPDGSRWALPAERIRREKIDFSNAYENSFSIPGYDHGIIIRLEIRRCYFHPEFISTFVLNHWPPTLLRTIRLSLPRASRLKYGLENCETADVQQSEMVEEGYRHITYTANLLKGRTVKRRTEFPEQWYPALHVSFPPEGLRSFSWQEIGDYYLDLSSDAFDVSPAIHDLGATIDGRTEEATLNAAFDTIVNKVRYHGDWEGRYAFYPRRAETILAHGYGDCKEISTLLHTLLKTKGVNTRLSLISTWNNHQPIAKYPSLDNFNHMVLAAPMHDGGMRFLDGTHRWAHAGNSYYALVGRKAFVIEAGNSRLVDVSPGTNFKSRVSTRTKILRNDASGRWMADGQIKLQGHPALRFYSLLKGNTTEENSLVAKRFLQDTFGIDPLEVSADAPTSDEAIISYRFAFQENYLQLGDGGFRLSLPRLYGRAVDRQLVDKFGPVYLESFEQQDYWELPETTEQWQLYDFEMPFARQQWSVDGATVSRRYRQSATRMASRDTELETWTGHCRRSGDNLVWK